MERIALVVPAIRAPERLDRCLDTALDAARDDRIEIELIVVLDGADVELRERMARRPAATTIWWPERRGFAAALNAGARAAVECRFIAVLQDDALPRPGWLRALLDVATTHDDVGVVGPLVVDGEGQVRRAGAMIGGDCRTADPWVGPPPPVERFTAARQVDYLSSSSLLVRRRTWEDVHGFDEELYPAVYVDADFCTAAWNAGWRVVLEPRSVVSHDIGGSTSERFRNFLYHRNRERFRAKWASCFERRPTFPTGQGDPDRVDPPGAWPRIHVDPPPAKVPDPETYRRREREVLREYVVELEAQLDQGTRTPSSSSSARLRTTPEGP